MLPMNSAGNITPPNIQNVNMCVQRTTKCYYVTWRTQRNIVASFQGLVN